MAGKSTEASPSASSSSSSPSSPKPEERSSGNWWDSWITSAKSKSAEVYSMVKKDLDEIGSAVKSEANHVFTTTSTVIGKTLKLDEPESPANVMKKSLSTFMGQVNTVLNPEPDDEDDTEVILSSGDTTMLSTYKKELESLQRLDATFIVPADSSEFEVWRGIQEPLEDRAVLRKLSASPLLRAQYEKLVPDAASHQQFWERYLYRVDLLQDRLAAASRKQHVEETTKDPVLAHLPLSTQPSPIIEESPKKVISSEDLETPEPEATPVIGDKVIDWEEEVCANDLELTEEQQTLLLEEYEKEIASKKITKQTSTKDITNNNKKNKSTATNNTGNTKKSQSVDKKNNSTIDKSNKNGRASKKAGKSDVCGNNLVEDYFAEKDQKDDSSSNSDGSWEKEFEIDDIKQKA